MTRRKALVLCNAIIVLELLPLAYAHGDYSAAAGANTSLTADNHDPPTLALANMDGDTTSYFHREEHSNTILAHIVLMTVCWVFVLPVAVMLSVARSRFHLLAQLAFLVANGCGVILGVVYSHQTPNLYENEKHGAIGWVGTLIASTWLLASFVTASAGYRPKGQQSRHSATLSSRFNGHRSIAQTRWAGNSGHGTGSNSSSSSSDTIWEPQQFGYEQPSYESDDTEENVEDIEERSLLRRSSVGRFFSHRIGRFSGSKWTLRFIRMIKTVLDRVMLLFGFLCIVTGTVVYGGIFHEKMIFSGLAHCIKGGIFFWYGFLTFGRWMGCFADFGWAWNKKPSKEIVGRSCAMVPSAEFVESATICFYGASNVWLEHLSNPGGKWAAVDLEHVSITLMFFGGGLLGMVIESTTIRELLMSTIQLVKDKHARAVSMRFATVSFGEPEQWNLPMNPMPALIILLLGLMLGAHHQASMVSTTMHAQWGNLFMGASIARFATYTVLYLRPPRSYLPQRPPTEIITSFCFVAGGLMFMMSNKDTVAALEYNSLGAMFVFNVTMGFTAFLMAWAAVCLAIKGWAQRQEAAITAR